MPVLDQVPESEKELNIHHARIRIREPLGEKRSQRLVDVAFFKMLSPPAASVALEEVPALLLDPCLKQLQPAQGHVHYERVELPLGA